MEDLKHGNIQNIENTLSFTLFNILSIPNCHIWCVSVVPKCFSRIKIGKNEKLLQIAPLRRILFIAPNLSRSKKKKSFASKTKSTENFAYEGKKEGKTVHRTVQHSSKLAAAVIFVHLIGRWWDRCSRWSVECARASSRPARDRRQPFYAVGERRIRAVSSPERNRSRGITAF